MGLKEPQVLNDMIGWQRRGAKQRNVTAVTDHALKLLARPMNEGESLVIKPSNIVNPLASMMMAMYPASRAILLHAPIDSFLQSIAKKEMWGRKWVRDVMIGTAKDRYLIGGMNTEELLGLTDLQVAAVIWLSQHNLFGKIVEQVGADRVRLLNSDRFLTNQKETMGALGQLFELQMDDNQLSRVMDGPAFTSHSKTDESFDAEARKEEQTEMAKLHGEEIGMVSQWAAIVAKNHNINLSPGRELLG